jgi:hypothetical protein
MTVTQLANKLPGLLQNPKCHNKFHKSSDPQTSESNRNLTPYFTKILRNIILLFPFMFFKEAISFKIFQSKLQTDFSTVSCVLHASSSCNSVFHTLDIIKDRKVTSPVTNFTKFRARELYQENNSPTKA